MDSRNRVGPLADSFVSGGGNLFYSPFSRISDHRVLPMVEIDSWKPAEGREQGEERSVCLRLHGSGSHSGDGKYCRRGGRSSCGRAGSRILDVGVRCPWHDDRLCGGVSGKKIPVQG